MNYHTRSYDLNLLIVLTAALECHGDAGDNDVAAEDRLATAIFKRGLFSVAQAGEVSEEVFAISEEVFAVAEEVSAIARVGQARRVSSNFAQKTLFMGQG